MIKKILIALAAFVLMNSFACFLVYSAGIEYPDEQYSFGMGLASFLWAFGLLGVFTTGWFDR